MSYEISMARQELVGKPEPTGRKQVVLKARVGGCKIRVGISRSVSKKGHRAYKVTGLHDFVGPYWFSSIWEAALDRALESAEHQLRVATPAQEESFTLKGQQAMDLRVLLHFIGAHSVTLNEVTALLTSVLSPAVDQPQPKEAPTANTVGQS